MTRSLLQHDNRSALTRVAMAREIITSFREITLSDSLHFYGIATLEILGSILRILFSLFSSWGSSFTSSRPSSPKTLSVALGGAVVEEIASKQRSQVFDPLSANNMECH
ncbi:hypothetical protein PoB_005701000 [Plakobranchus ocellatus]|uniref:Uncharacterized protein n=1 Tax=Plakobranchus ocellatus TaxID=259542 RepID=A0AAV4CCN3_9GAST|nr:hypothetical protein PoB_005701000 [Plakobranchus ocellatus]